MAALGSVNLLLRNAINIALISMVGVSNSSVNGEIQNNTAGLLTTAVVCPQYQANSTTDEHVSQYQHGEFDWSLAKQGLLLSCYYYGYTVSNMPGAWLSKRFGIRATLGIASFIAAILTILIPVTARLSFGLLIALRATLGLLQGVTMPTIMQSIGIWSPPCENTRHMAISFVGTASGNLFTYAIAGLVVWLFGWECVFYVTGSIGLLWSIAWFLLIHDSPLKHPRISIQESNYITESLSDAASAKSNLKNIPWRKIFTSKPYLSTVVAHLAENWTLVITYSWMPQYIAKVLGFSIENPTYQPIYYYTYYCLLADSGYRVAVADMAPSYLGIIYSFSNMLTGVLALCATQLVGIMLGDGSLPYWRTVFYVTSAISAFGLSVFLWFGTCELQPWAKIKKGEADIDDKEIFLEMHEKL
ncbi:sialin-like [Ciona intestinalis]